MASRNTCQANIDTSYTETQTVETEFAAPTSDTIIIDLGTSACKVGYSGEDRQRLSIPSVVGRPKKGVAVGMRSDRDTYVGFEAQQKRAVLDLKHPIERGIINNWDDMESYFEYIFREGLQIDPSQFGILLTEVLNNPPQNREKLIEIMLEKFYLKSFFLAPAPPLALYAYGFYTGVVVDSGEGQTHVVPVYEGFSMRHGTSYLPLGGGDLNRLMETFLVGNPNVSRYLQKSKDRDFIRHLKEELCYVAFDVTEEPKEGPKSYRLPDGNYIELRNELFQCPEALFEPQILGVKTGGIHENVYRAVQLPDPSLKSLLYSHVVLSGGNTLFEGFQHRLAKEMRYISEPDSVVRIHAKSDRKDSVFFGASLVSSLAKFKEMVIAYPEYYETGPSIVNRKCF